MGFIESVVWGEEKNLSWVQHVVSDILHESRSLSPFSIHGYFISSYEHNLTTTGVGNFLFFFYFYFHSPKDIFVG